MTTEQSKLADRIEAGEGSYRAILTEEDRKMIIAALRASPTVTVEALMFEFYRFSWPQRWDWPLERMWDDFKACRGSVTWKHCERSAKAIRALIAQYRDARPRPCPQEWHDYCVWPRCDCVTSKSRTGGE